MKQAHLKSISPIHVLSIEGKQKRNEHFTLSVPFAPGELLSHEDVKFFDNHDKEVLAYATPLSYWQDKSVRWLNVKGYLPLSCANDSAQNKIYLKKSTYQHVKIKEECVQNTTDTMHIKVIENKLSLSKTKFLDLIITPLNVKLAFAVKGKSTITQTKIQHTFETEYTTDNTPYGCLIKQSAALLTEGERVGSLNARIAVNFASASIDIQVDVHNCQAQVPEQGKWDLGNPNSLSLKSMGFELTTPQDYQRSIYISNDAILDEKNNDASNTNKCLYNQASYNDTNITLVQHSSGGKHWNSPNHKGADNKVTLSHKGASFFDGASNKIIERANPILLTGSEEQTLSITPRHFWQKFPASIELNAHCCSINYVDIQTPDTIEIQPGETKSHSISLALHATGEATPYSDVAIHGKGNKNDKEFQVFIPPSRIDVAKTLPWFSNAAKHEKLHSIVELGLSSESNFYEKREALDEFGWRHFGDIYADHEADTYDGDLPFVSHYNNQYDPLYGLLKQWLLDGNRKWRELADDLFDHLINIDIYRTEHDKPEYNNGLFWHTDHYVQAETATHRTYSRHQASDVYMDHAGGGGPGAHHCYSSGIALYYFLTGDERAASTVLGMANWMKHIYEGDGTLLGKFLQLKNANHLTIPFGAKLLLGAGTGIVRNPITNNYPLDRGTGNYVNVLLDAFELTQEPSYLDDIERVILNTIKEDDNFKDRHFEDIENTWFYTVFLQATAKYLYFVSTFNLTRAACKPILSALVHYVDYIAQHEQPALKSAEVLEYPNDTWTGQDIRKVQLLCIGSLLVNEPQKTIYLNKAAELNDWISQKLFTSNERFYTRILALTMQNYGSIELVNDKQYKLPLDLSDTKFDKHVCPSTTARIRAFINTYSFKKERRLLLTRIPKLQKILGKP
ncbi:hypothetical protein [Agaribacter marinus]|uniref:Uncharacterized protein n=1 Tax=Agaribacter marinus TaxID=1431249 RepID=A0AA37WIF4_9ALTE|nr:hypothetical protein [Agaribacter marinus]GLR70922.1 hypothetical protein GCM10007852_18300 [Agaribacter marinus]